MCSCGQVRAGGEASAGLGTGAAGSVGRQAAERGGLPLFSPGKSFTCFTVYYYKSTNTDAYLSTLQELQQAILSQSATIQVLSFRPNTLVAEGRIN